MSFPRIPLALVAGALLFAGCPDDSKLPIGSSCAGDGSCASGYCIANLCLDPNADDDGDGLINSIEGALGTNPQSADTDGDGVSDYDEVVNANSPQDTDGDGKSDAVESILNDLDQDCIVDQLDAKDDEPETDPVVLAGFVCLKAGVCGASGAVVSATCGLEGDKRVHHCDYTQVTGYEATEASCDELDNDCNSVTDEPFTAGGTVTYTDADGTTGKVKGSPCGIGACSGGVVVCQDATTLTCSTLGSGVAEVCDDVDNDCDGDTDEDFAAGGSVVFDGGGWGSDAGKVLGDGCGTGACAGGTVVCAADDDTSLACSTAGQASAEACGDDVDNDCEGTTDEGENLVSCIGYFYDDDEDGYGVTEGGKCLCAPDGGWTTTEPGDCDDDDEGRSPGADPICGVDADCDDQLVDAGEACDDGDDATLGDGCQACEVTETAVTLGTPQYRNDTAAAAFADGSFGLCWVDGYPLTFGALGTSGVACSFFDPDGIAVGTFVVDDNDTLSHTNPQMTALSTGDVIVAWREYDYQLGTNGIYGQRLDPAGTPKGEPWRLDDVDFDYLEQDFSLAPLDGGGFVVAWLGSYYEAYDTEPRARAFDGADAPRHDSVAATGAGYISEIAAIGFDDGTYLVGWLRQDLELYHDHLEVRRFAANGEPGGEVQPGVPSDGPDDVRTYTLVAFPGGAFMTFYAYDAGDFQYALAGQAFTPDGTADGAPVVVIAAGTAELPYRFSAAALVDGTVGLAYAGYSQGESDVTATLWLIPTTPATAPLEVLLETLEGAQSDDTAAVAATPTGPFVVGWPGRIGEQSGSDIFYQRVNADGSKRYH